MKKMALLLALFFTFFACSDSGSDNGIDPPTPPTPPFEGKKELMFLIDEGIKGEELIAKFKDDLNALDNALENIYKELSPLQEKYDVSVLIYPTWLYKETGYGQGNAATGVNRIDPALIHTFDYFKKKGIGVYLEMYSSGIYTAQNGELGNLPLVKRRYGGTETIKSLPLDLDCLEDILSKYEVVKGIRFHELIGSHEQRDNGHGFAVDFTLTTEMAEICKKHDKRLVWGDHSWDLAYTDPGKYGMWITNLEAACDILGDKITVNFNNNGWGSEMIALNYSRTMANFRNNNKWGYSVQSWWWQEVAAQSYPKWEDGSIRWHADADLDMPVELMAAFSLETFRRGGSMVQYEPAFYLFNYYSPASSPSRRPGQYEQSPDYSGRLILKRLVKALLDYDTNQSAYPSMKPSDYYVNNRQEMMENKWSKKTKTYNQTTLTVLGDKVKVFDTYISNIGKWFGNDDNRYRNWVFTNNVKDATRIKVDFRMIDEILVVKPKSGKLTAEVYNYMSAYYTNCDNLVETTTNGDFAGIVALNLKKNYPGKSNTFFGDPDEVVVARTNGTNIKFTVYEKVFKNNGSDRQNFAYAEDYELTSQINAQFGTVTSDKFISLLGMRTENILFTDNTRSLDNLLLATKTDNAQTAITGKIQGSVSAVEINKIIDINPSNIKDIKCADANCDYVDELAVLKNNNTIDFYECNVKGNCDFTLKSSLENVGTNSNKILATRWTSYYNE